MLRFLVPKVAEHADTSDGFAAPLAAGGDASAVDASAAPAVAKQAGETPSSGLGKSASAPQKEPPKKRQPRAQMRTGNKRQRTATGAKSSDGPATEQQSADREGETGAGDQLNEKAKHEPKPNSATEKKQEPKPNSTTEKKQEGDSNAEVSLKGAVANMLKPGSSSGQKLLAQALTTQSTMNPSAVFVQSRNF